MAIFASTTTSGYSDPMKAMTIKALEKRQADMLAAQLKGGEITPENTQTPVQGFGHLFNQLGDQMREGRVEAAAAARRQELANVMAGIGPEGPTAQQMAQIHSADPELGAKLVQQAFEARQSKAQQAFQSGENALTRGETQASRQQQGELAREQMGVTKSEAALTRQQQLDLATQSQKSQFELAEAQRRFDAGQADLNRAHQTGDKQMQIEATQKLEALKSDLQMKQDAAKAQSDQGKIKRDVQGGFLTPEEGATALKPEPKPAAVKGLAEAKTAYTNHAQEIGNLERAKGILDKGINTGPYAGAATGVANLSGGYLGDKEKAQRTTDFNNIINAETIKRMSETLKGASTDFEMKKFIEVYNNPNASDEARRTALDNLITAAKIGKDTHGASVKAFGGDTAEIDAQLSKGPAAAEGGGEVKAVASEAEAMKLPPNTKFKLPDGRTGTAR
jgi:hypothetical protein